MVGGDTLGDGWVRAIGGWRTGVGYNEQLVGVGGDWVLIGDFGEVMKGLGGWYLDLWPLRKKEVWVLRREVSGEIFVLR